MKQIITSTKNEKYKHFKALKLKKTRMESKQYTVEGIKSVKDAVASGVKIDAIIITENLYNTLDFEIPEHSDIYIVPDELFSGLSTTENSQGIMAVIKMCNEEAVLSKEKAYIYCDRIQDPGNLGTIIRTADAAGFGGVLMSEDCVDLYNPKTVRSSMGSFFHIPKYESVDINKLIEYKNDGFGIVCGVLSDKTINYTEADMTKPVIIVIGNEANGICDDVLEISDINIKIPIDGSAESLNAAVAAAIIMYEVNRQRRKSAN